MPPVKRTIVRGFAAFALGAASVAAFAPLGFFPLIFVTLAGLFALLDRAADAGAGFKRGAMLAGAFGFGLFLGGVSWIYVSLSTFGGMPMPLAGLATVLFCAVLALFPALAGGIFVAFAPAGRGQRCLAFAAAWTLAEWLRGWVLSGFPWLTVGYTQTPPSPLAGFAPVVGVYGLSLLTALTAAPLWIAVRRWRENRACGCGGWRCPTVAFLPAIVIAAVGFNLNEMTWTQPVGTPLRVALLQGNIPQDIKWRPEWFEESLRTYHRLMIDHPAQLTLLPETALPAFLDQIPNAYLEELHRLALREQGDVVLGIAIGDATRYANAAFAFGASGMQRYDKVHLVPFGEIVPPGFRGLMRLIDIPLSDFTPGAEDQPPMHFGDQRVAIDICYEDAFGDAIAHALPEATLLANLSNVAWFGDSLAPAQHLQISRMRAMETGRPMLRSTNTGMTAIIDPKGRVIDRLTPFTRGALSGEVSGYAGSTPFVRWGNAPTILFAFALLGTLLRRKRRG